MGLDEDMDDFIVDDDGAGYAHDFSRPDDLKRYHETGKQRAIRELYKGIQN